MPSYDKKGRSKQALLHVRLYHTMTRTPAWRDLDTAPRAAYCELSSRYGGPGSNNGRIPFSAREMAKALNVSRSTAWRAFKHLQTHGFIAVKTRGAFSMKRRHATEWRLTEFSCDVTNSVPTRDYQHWKKQNTVSRMGPTVSRVKPDGFMGETIYTGENPKKTLYGFTGETPNAAHGFTHGTLVVNQSGLRETRIRETTTNKEDDATRAERWLHNIDNHLQHEGRLEFAEAVLACKFIYEKKLRPMGTHVAQEKYPSEVAHLWSDYQEACGPPIFAECSVIDQSIIARCKYRRKKGETYEPYKSKQHEEGR